MVTDGPFGETKEVIGGYWFILAGSLEEASARLPQRNPCLNCGLCSYEILAASEPGERATPPCHRSTTEDAGAETCSHMAVRP